MSLRTGTGLFAVALFSMGMAPAQTAAPAQSAAPAPTKVAVINLQRAVLETAEIKKASAAMEAKYKPRQQELEKLQTELSGIQQQLNSGKLTEEQAANLQADGQRKQRDLQRQTDDLNTDVSNERNDILSKATQKMSEVVKKLAEQKGFDMVVDVSSTVYFKPAMEITSDAIAAYDQAYPAK
ncbi:MAG TPA: OmpH family outer membrane protein [Bryobacteraceae bacterium]|nr:OmpH family outer membrane protein [Bryobacteraceae bacterium]